VVPRRIEELEVLKAADLLRAEGLLQHCLEGFGGGMTVATAVEELVWAHQEGPAEAREMATEFFVRNCKAIRVRAWGLGVMMMWRAGFMGHCRVLVCMVRERARAKQRAVLR